MSEFDNMDMGLGQDEDELQAAQENPEEGQKGPTAPGTTRRREKMTREAPPGSRAAWASGWAADCLRP